MPNDHKFDAIISLFKTGWKFSSAVELVAPGDYEHYVNSFKNYLRREIVKKRKEIKTLEFQLSKVKEE